MHIMLIDDDRDNMAELSNFLQALGHSCNQFANAYKALENYRINHYDLVITDLIMPHLDGIEVLKMILQAKPEAIIVVVTAFTNPKIMAGIIKQGAYTVLAKPLNINRFIDTMETIALQSGIRQTNLP